ncbi:hypothetical protein [Wolbachia pipientis]|uniref:hypothetical protein n=1 Tax=Wolbachia pipientis TaxID=955 RepID=UPI00202F5234|nr:hypothetical protein [Wolbachia pipientis]MCM1002025.1 hypothetical protein [Wolbachia pipientis]
MTRRGTTGVTGEGGTWMTPITLSFQRVTLDPIFWQIHQKCCIMYLFTINFARSQCHSLA